MIVRVPFWAPPLLAVQFLTRLPVPVLARLTPDQARAGLRRATGWLPLVGGGIGLVTALVFVVAHALWPVPVAVLLALAAEAWLTGAFHEDAVADFCDAFGGGSSSEQIHRIMKDSRIGSYGALGLGLAVALRATATAALPAGVALATIVAAAGFARLCAVALMLLAPPAPLPDAPAGLAKDIGRVPWRTGAAALLTVLPALAPLALLAPGALAAAVLAMAAALVWLARGLIARIGGSTGDCLGFAAYLGQIALLLAVAAGR